MMSGPKFVHREVKTILVFPICSKCEKGQMTFDKETLSNSPEYRTTRIGEESKYPHICPECGHKEDYNNAYPITNYKFV